MLTIEFGQGNMFDQKHDPTDVLAFIGRNKMQFALDRNWLENLIPAQENVFDPFTERPFELIPVGARRYLCCIPGDFMSDEECSNTMERLFDMVSQRELESIAFNGVRDSRKANAATIEGAIQLDNNRVKFIVEKIIEWYYRNRATTTINRILLIATSDNFTRNYNHRIIIE